MDFKMSMSYSLLPYTISSSTPWILDSGATPHIVHSIHSYTVLQNKFATLPNTTKVPATAIGTVYLTNEFLLSNVLYIPDFHVNLISVSSLVSHGNYKVIFTNSDNVSSVTCNVSYTNNCREYSCAVMAV